MVEEINMRKQNRFISKKLLLSSICVLLLAFFVFLAFQGYSNLNFIHSEGPDFLGVCLAKLRGSNTDNGIDKRVKRITAS